MRVVAGEFRSRRLERPPSGVRPTADRVRESLFARLADVTGARILDLYAGTGALAIEALSRGAANAVLVERAPKALAVIHENVAQLGIASRCRVVRGDATTWLERLAKAGERFDLIFVDPPYASGEAQLALDAIARGSVLAESGAILVESAKGQPLEAVEGLRQIDEWLYGDTVVARWSR